MPLTSTVKKDYLTVIGGKTTFVMDNGSKKPVVREMTLDDGTKVSPDGTVMTKDGKTLALKEGEKLSMDGKITPNPAMEDHIMSMGGKMWVRKNGKFSAMEKDTSLPDGTKVTMDGTIVLANGRSLKTGDGDFVLMTGEVVQASKKMDHVIIKNGALMVVKNGRSSKAEKSITLSDGTVVTKDGSATSPDGSTFSLQEGDMILMDGNVMQSRSPNLGPAGKNL